MSISLPCPITHAIATHTTYLTHTYTAAGAALFASGTAYTMMFAKQEEEGQVNPAWMVAPAGGPAPLIVNTNAKTNAKDSKSASVPAAKPAPTKAAAKPAAVTAVARSFPADGSVVPGKNPGDPPVLKHIVDII